MRLFIAIPLADRIKQSLLDLAQPIKGVRWQQKEQLHLTLKFVGEVDYRLSKVLRKRLEDITHNSFLMTIKAVGYFPERKQPKVIWAGVAENSSLTLLHQKIEDCCEELGIAPEGRPFKPHITIGRTKNMTKRAINSFINQRKTFIIPDIRVDEFVLYESKLHHDGARHGRLQTYSLHEE